MLIFAALQVWELQDLLSGRRQSKFVLLKFHCIHTGLFLEESTKNEGNELEFFFYLQGERDGAPLHF